VRNGQVEMTAEDESETVGLLPKDEPPEGEEDSVSAPNSGPDPRKLPQLVLDAPLPPTIDDDAPGADYWLDDDAEADELEAGDEPGPLRSMSEDPDSPRCLRLGSTKSEPAHSRFSGSADLLLLRAEESGRSQRAKNLSPSVSPSSSITPSGMARMERMAEMAEDKDSTDGLSMPSSLPRSRQASIAQSDEKGENNRGEDRTAEGQSAAKKGDSVQVTVTAAEGASSQALKPSAQRNQSKAATHNSVLLSPIAPVPKRLPRSRSKQNLLQSLQALVQELNARKVRTVELVANAEMRGRSATEDEEAERSICSDPGATFTELARCVLRRDVEKVSKLVRSGVSVNMALREEHGGFVHFSTLLHAVCDMPTEPTGLPQEGCVPIIEALILAKANINPRNSTGATPIMYACRQKNVEVVKMLISHGARVWPCDEDGHSCMNWAVALYEEEKPLCAKNPRQPLPDDEERSSYLVELLLVAATLEIEFRPVKRMYSAVASVALASPSMFQNPAKRRASLEHEPKDMNLEDADLADFGELVKPQPETGLLAVEAADAVWFPPLRFAVMQGNLGAATIMMECGAPPVWLHDAVATGRPELVESLLRHTADPAARDAQGISSIDFAVQAGADYQIVDLLRQNVHKRRSSGAGDSLQVHNRKSSIVSTVSIRSLLNVHDNVPRSPSSRSVMAAKNAEPAPEPKKESAALLWLSTKSQKLFATNGFQSTMFICLSLALYLPDVYALTDLAYDSLDALLLCIFLCFVVDFVVQVFGFYQTYMFSFFFYMDIIGTLSLIIELSPVRVLMQGNAITNNSVVMRATRAAKLGARAGRLTRLVKLLRFLPFLSKRGAREPGSTAKVISSRLISRVSSVVACLIILSVQVLPLPGTFAYPTQDFSIQMWTAHLRRSIEETRDAEMIAELVNEFRAFYDRTSYKPYFFRNDTQVLWESRGPLQADRSVRIQNGAVEVMFDFSTQVQVEAALNMSIITITIILMVLFSLLISRAIARHALAPLETMLLKVRKIGRLIWLQVESIHTLLSNSQQDARKKQQDEQGDETVLLKEVLSRISLLSALKLIRPDEDAQAVVFLGTSAGGEVRPSNTLTMQHREMIQTRLQTVVLQDLTNLEVENLTSWRFNPLDLESNTTCFVCAKLLSTCMPSSIKEKGVTETEISAFIATVEEGYLKVPYHSWSHAVDVMHSVYVILQDLHEAFSRTERYALLICAVVHDIGHPGFSNEFLVQTHHDLALRYNDNAPLESMHCARLFEILGDPSTNVWGELADGARKDVRKMCIEAILHTDNSCHFNVVKACQMIHEVHDEVFSNVLSKCSSVEDHKESWPSPEVLEIIAEKETHDTLRNMLLHFADISNSMKPFTVARPWALLVLEEFFVQGEKMTELGLPVPALNDRQKTNRPTSQIGFIEFIVSPLVFTIVKILPPIGYTEQAMWGNVKAWFEEWASTASPSKSEFQQMANRITKLYEKVTFAKQGTAFLRRSNSI